MSVIRNFAGKALILGGGSDQKRLVVEFNLKGYYTIIVDYYDHPPAKAIANKHYKKSNYDRYAVLKIAQKEKVNFVTTISTDQPLLVAAWVSEQLGLKSHISYQQALDFTNKRNMKRILFNNGIPTSKYVILEKVEDISSANQLKYPLIIKPVDSSGSRGVFIVNNPVELEKAYFESKQFSKSGCNIAEEFLFGKEISVDSIVVNKKARIISITENLLTNKISTSPLFIQSIHPLTVSDEVKIKIVEKTTKAFNIIDSPLFLQMIIVNNDVYVIELSARIAGGSKPYYVPVISGFDIVRAYIDQLLEESIAFETNYSSKITILNYIYGTEGKFMNLKLNDAITLKEYIVDVIEYKTSGSMLQKATNGSDRIGAFIIQGNTFRDAHKNIQQIDNNLKALDESGNDMMIHGLYSETLRDKI